MIAFAAVEWNWGEAILDESWRDVLSIAGLIVTVVGFLVTIWQLWKTRSAALAAELAAERALEESRFAYHKFAIALAHRYLQEAKIHADNKAWEKAGIRLSDLTSQLHHLLAMDESWNAFIIELDAWSITYNRLSAQEVKRFDKKKWLDLCGRLERKLNEKSGPFS